MDKPVNTYDQITAPPKVEFKEPLVVRARRNKKQKDPTSSEVKRQKVRADAILTIESERTIENGVDYLVRVYSFIKHNSLDIGNFIRNYAWRPVASMVDVLGGADFGLLPLPGGDYLAVGQEGFHSRAFGDVEDLFGLVDPKVGDILGLKKDAKKLTAAKKLDVRKRRREVIRSYVEELTNSKGLLG